MKTIIKKYLVIAAIASLVLPLATCKKYEEGPWFSFVSARDRITEPWELKEFLINNCDSLTLFKGDYNNQVIFCRDNDDYYFYFFGGSSHGQWELSNNKKKINLSITYSEIKKESLGPFNPGCYSEWEIIRLTRDDFWICTNYMDKEYYVKMKNIK